MRGITGLIYVSVWSENLFWKYGCSVSVFMELIKDIISLPILSCFQVNLVSNLNSFRSVGLETICFAVSGSASFEMWIANWNKSFNSRV